MIEAIGTNVGLSDIIPRQAREWRNHTGIRYWCRQNTLISLNHHTNWLDRIERDPSIKMFGIEDTLKAEPVGVCGLTSIDQTNQKAEFSIYIAPDKQRFGYGPTALRTLVNHGFKDLNLNRIWGEVFTGNPALKTFLDIGFKEEGIQKQAYFRDGKFIDSHIIGLLRQDFIK